MALDLAGIAGAYTRGVAGLGSVDVFTNLLSLLFLCACLAFALRGSGALFSGALLISAMVVRLPTFLPILANPDEASMLAGARRLFYDPIFWRSVDGATTGPLDYYALAALRAIGLPLDFATARVANVLCMWGAMVFLWLAARSIMPEWAARISVLPWLAALLGFRFGEFLQYSSECVPLLLGSLAIWLLFRQRWFTLGLVVACLPLAKLQAAPLAVVLGIAAITRLWRGGRNPAIRFAGGCVSVLLTLSILLTAFGVWRDFYESYVRSNWTYANRPEVEWTLPQFSSFVFRSEFGRFVGWMSLWILPVAAWRRRVSREALVATGLFVGSLYAVYRPGRPFAHYLLFLLLPVSLGAAVALAVAIKHGHHPTLACTAFVLVTVAAPTLQGVLQAAPDSLAALSGSSTAVAAPITNRLSAWAKPGDLVAVWGWAPELYVLTGTVPATRDPHTQTQIEGGPQRAYYRQRFEDDLRAHPPVVFADAVGPLRLAYEDRATQGYESVPELRGFVDANYDLMDDVQSVRLFVRRGAREVVLQAPVRAPVAIVCGGPEDRFHLGGGSFEFPGEIAPAAYRSMRFCRSTCEYSIPLDNGSYRLRLHFIELVYPAPGARIFDVTVNHAPALRDLDIFRETGGYGRAFVREIPVEVTAGRLTIGLIPKVREAEISRIEVVK
jgi:Malectin domain